MAIAKSMNLNFKFMKNYSKQNHLLPATIIDHTIFFAGFDAK